MAGGSAMAADYPISIWPTAQQGAPAQRRGRYLPVSGTHPAKMLPAIAARAIATYTAPGDLVVDPMCGIGTTLVEAAHLGRDAIGVEYEARWAGLAEANLAHARAQGATGHGEVVRGDARHLGGLVDPAAREAWKAGKPLHLTLKELDLLLFFAANPRQVFSRDQLMDRVWGYSTVLDTGTVTVHVQRLGMNCLYCHYTANKSPDPGLPAVGTCMGCHLIIGPTLNPVPGVRTAPFRAASRCARARRRSMRSR